MLGYSVKNIIASDEVPLVLLHGFLESSSMWGHVEFPVGYPIVTVDLPGHGKSKDSSLMCDTIEEMANSVILVLDKLELTTYHLIGHSMGGYVGLEIKRMDARLEKIMLLNSNFWADSPQKVKDRIRVSQIVKTNKSHFIYEVIPNLFLNPQKFDADVKELIADAMKMSPESISTASIAMSKRTDHTELVVKNARDFAILQGAEDPIVPISQMRRLLKGSEVKYTELEAVGHMAHLEARQKLDDFIGEFLK